MTTATVLLHTTLSPRFKMALPSIAVSDRGGRYGSKFNEGDETFEFRSKFTEQTVGRMVSNALVDAKEAVLASSTYLGQRETERFLSRLTDLLDEENWDDEGPFPTYVSVRSAVYARIAVDAPFSSISIGLHGNLKITWFDFRDGGTLFVEGNRDGSISWEYMRESADHIDRCNGADEEFGQFLQG